MLLKYIGKKAPITLSMRWLTKAITFDKEPVEVPNREAKRLLSENPKMLRVFGNHGKVGFEIVEEEDIETPLPKDDEDDKKDPPGPDGITKESLDELTKAEIGELIKEKFDIDLTTTKNKEAVIFDALAIVAAA